MSYLFSHTDAVALQQSEGVLSKLLHQSTWVGLLIVVGLTCLLAFILKFFKLSFPTRVLICVGGWIIMGILYLPHNASVTGIVLSAGFIITFLMTFAMLGKR